MGIFVRQKTVDCGVTKDVAVYCYTTEQAARDGRHDKRRRRKVAEPKIKDLNDERAARYFTQLCDLNFGENDYHVVYDYRDECLPATSEEADRNAKRAVSRLGYMYKKLGVELRYILVTAFRIRKKDNKVVRAHHHLLVSGGDGIDRDKLKSIWKYGRGNVDELQPEDGTIAALASYLRKQPQEEGRRRWRSSLNLKKPTETVNDSAWSSKRQFDKVAKSPLDVKLWEKRFPGWTVVRPHEYGYSSSYNEVTGTWTVRVRLRRLKQ